MNLLDQKIRQVVAELIDTAPIAEGALPERTTTKPVAGHSRMVLVGVLVGLAVIAMGFITLVRSPGEVPVATEPTPPTTTTTITTTEQSVGDRWPYPRTLPEGYEFDFAMEMFDRLQIAFTNAKRDSFGVSIVSDTSMFSLREESFDIDGETWRRADGGYFRPSDGVLVFASLPQEARDAMLGSIELVDESALPRPPIPVEETTAYIDVATTERYGATVTMGAISDGLYYATGDGSGFGCCVRLGEGMVIAIGRAGHAGPAPEGQEAIALVDAIVDESVVLVEVQLRDGSTMEVEPQDINDAFPVNFLFIAIPTERDADPFRELVAAVAFDGDGNEIGRFEPR